MAVKSTFTVAGPRLVSIIWGVKRSEVSFGLTVSVADFTSRIVGKPTLARSSEFKTRVLPAASARSTELSVHRPASLNRGNVTSIALDADREASSLAERPRLAPDGLTKLRSP